MPGVEFQAIGQLRDVEFAQQGMKGFGLFFGFFGNESFGFVSVFFSGL